MSRSGRRGFSILETVAILVIIALLLLIVIPQFTKPSLAAVAGPDSVVAAGTFGALAVKVPTTNGTYSPKPSGWCARSIRAPSCSKTFEGWERGGSLPIALRSSGSLAASDTGRGGS